MCKYSQNSGNITHTRNARLTVQKKIYMHTQSREYTLKGDTKNARYIARGTKNAH